MPGDLNGDNYVDGLDEGILLGNFESYGNYLYGELDGIGLVDGLDFGILLGNWNEPVQGMHTGFAANLQLVANINGDSEVDGLDLATLLTHLGIGTTLAEGDLDDDQDVDFDDLRIMLTQFGFDIDELT